MHTNYFNCKKTVKTFKTIIFAQHVSVNINHHQGTTACALPKLQYSNQSCNFGKAQAVTPWWCIYLYWTLHHCDSWRIRDQLDVTSYKVLFHFFYAQHVSDINTSIIRSLRLFYCITTLVVCSCFDVCWSFGVAGLGWYPCSRLQPDDGCINVRNMLHIEEVK